MTSKEHSTIDYVAFDADSRLVVLVIVEDRPWGNCGMLLPDLQAKFETYLNYVVSGQLKADYPATTDVPVRIELRCAYEPGERERKFIDIVVSNHFRPEKIGFAYKLITE
jgi:Family of unknown function (DUF6572)